MRLTSTLSAIVRVAIGINLLFGVTYLAAFAASFVFGDPVAARIAAKYGPGVDAAAILWLLRGLCVVGLAAVWSVARLFAALRGILAATLAGDPFATDNTARLRAIGWTLLALQFLDLLVGAASGIATRMGVDVVGWSPSFTGWFAAFVAFVLAQVFARATAMRDDLAGTV